jgi:hypothetical protein
MSPFLSTAQSRRPNRYPWINSQDAVPALPATDLAFLHQAEKPLLCFTDASICITKPDAQRWHHECHNSLGVSITKCGTVSRGNLSHLAHWQTLRKVVQDNDSTNRFQIGMSLRRDHRCTSKSTHTKINARENQSAPTSVRRTPAHQFDAMAMTLNRMC